MAAVHYGHFFDANLAGQTGEDDWRCPSAPPDIRAGKWRIYYIPRMDSDYAETRCLLSVDQGDDEEFSLAIVPGDGGTVVVTLGADEPLSFGIEFSAGARLIFDVDAVAGTVEVFGATTGNGVHTALEGWSLDDGAMRIGGSVLGAGKSAFGMVSYPYAVSIVFGGGSGSGSGEDVIVFDPDGGVITLDEDGVPIGP